VAGSNTGGLVSALRVLRDIPVCFSLNSSLYADFTLDSLLFSLQESRLHAGEGDLLFKGLPRLVCEGKTGETKEFSLSAIFKK